MSDADMRERAADMDYMLVKLEQRILAMHGGTADPMKHHWNLTEGDSVLHRDLAAAIRALLAQDAPEYEPYIKDGRVVA